MLVACSISCGTVNAESSDTPPPQLMKLIEKNVITVIDTFKHDSFTGWLVENGADYHLYWATEDNYVVAGPLIDESGINITAKYLESKKPTVNYDAVFKQFEQEAGYVSTSSNAGKSKGVVYVFTEPFCGWCSKVYEQLQPHIKNGLEVRWVPVAFLSGKSPGVVEYIVSAKDPIQAMADHEQIRKARGQVNSLPVTKQTKALLDTNSEFMSKFGINGTPGLVYQLEGKVHVAGYMKNGAMSALVSKIQNNGKVK